jgi:hypothetical protein
MRAVIGLALAALCAGCAMTEVVRFQPRAQQEALVRDGNPALVSRKKASLVIVRPAAREFRTGGRPVFVVGINNLTNGPVNFRVVDVEVTQTTETESVPIKVITYEDLVNEEKTRQVMAAIGVGLGAMGNAISASQAGRYSANTMIYTPRGIVTAHTTGYSPAAAAIAQQNANMQNEAMISATIERGQQNLAALEQGVIKDNTLFPGEWYGGQLHLSPPASVSKGAKHYTIALLVGSERHEIEVSQESVK